MRTHNDYPQDDPILRMRDVEKSVGLKKPTIYKLIKQSQFPSPINLGGRASGWLLSEIIQWKAERVAISRGEQKNKVTRQSQSVRSSESVESIDLLEHLSKTLEIYRVRNFHLLDRKGGNTAWSRVSVRPWGFIEKIEQNPPSDCMYYIFKNIFMDVIFEKPDGLRVARLLRSFGVSIIRPSELAQNRLSTSEKLPNSDTPQQVIKLKLSSLNEVLEELNSSGVQRGGQ